MYRGKRHAKYCTCGTGTHLAPPFERFGRVPVIDFTGRQGTHGGDTPRTDDPQLAVIPNVTLFVAE
jgi:hypothetical protein